MAFNRVDMFSTKYIAPPLVVKEAVITNWTDVVQFRTLMRILKSCWVRVKGPLLSLGFPSGPLKSMKWTIIIGHQELIVEL